ncbi:MAG TPA: hypothetical protein DEA08_19115 [Planctomycetes bacterium]|nr:hypothetical protein [Planctomycetota bacterium]
MTTTRALFSLFLCLVLLGGAPAWAKLDKKEFGKLKKQLKFAQAKGDTALLVEALEGLAKDDSDRAVGLVLKVAAVTKVDKAKVYAAAESALSEMGSAEATAELIKFASKRGPSLINILAINAMAQREDGATAKALGEALSDKRPEVLRAALRAIRLRKAGECVPGMIDLLEKMEKHPDALILGDLRRALIETTGKWFDVIEDWRKYWKHESHEGKRVMTGSAKELLKTAERGKKPPKFFGTEIRSERIVFVIDVSGSMEGDRLKKSKEQLTKCINGLDARSSFTVMCYSSQIRPWNSKLQPANPKNKAKAISFVETLQANGNTRTRGALVQAFETLGADTIVLLSDGMPTGTKPNGKDVYSEDEILGEVAGINKTKQWEIHTFGFGQKGGTLADFMEALAKQNHGKFTRIE